MRASLKLGPFEAPSGTAVNCLVPVGQLADGVTPLQVLVVIINGREDGPILYLHAGSHGQETIYAVETLRRLRAGLDPALLKGAVIAVPVANLLAHHFAARIAPTYAGREGVAFAGDLQQLWPGSARGSMTQRIAHFLWTELVRRCDCAIDLHAVSLPGMSFTLMIRGAMQEAVGTPAWGRSIELAQAFGLTVVTTAPSPQSLVGLCLDSGKPAFMVEMTGARILDETVVVGALRGIRNVLVKLRMTEGRIELQPDIPVLPGPHETIASLRARRGGFIRFIVPCGSRLTAGTVIARTCDVFGTEVEVFTMPVDGYVMTFPPLSWVGHQAVATGDLVADICS